MKRFIYLTALSVITAFGFNSCSKPGCTDSRATNYSADVNEDDGTCVYRGDITFWCLPDVSTTLKDAGHTVLRFELEGQIVDSVVTEFFFSPTGDCGTAGAKTIARDDLPYEYRHYKYRVRGLENATLYEGFVTLDANECLSIQLE